MENHLEHYAKLVEKYAKFGPELQAVVLYRTIEDYEN